MSTIPAVARNSNNQNIIQPRESEAEKYRNKHVDPITQEPLSKTVMLQCGHSFTKDVPLVQWIRDKKTCPCCRTNVSNSMPDNFYANELYQDNQELANKVDTLHDKVDKFSIKNERLQDALIKNGRASFIMELNKNVQIKELSNKVDDLTMENGILRNGLELATKENNNLKAEITTLRTDIGEMKTSMDMLMKKIVTPSIISPENTLSKPTTQIVRRGECPLIIVAKGVGTCIKRLVCCERDNRDIISS